MAEFGTIPRGQRWVSMDATLRNVGSSAITLQGIGIQGQGVGTVVEVQQTHLVLLDGPERTVTPRGIYRVFPPAIQVEGSCRVASLAPVKGFVLAPDEAVRALFVVEAAETGAFSWRGVTAIYEVDGSRFRELVSEGERGRVVADAPEHPTPTGSERRCAREAGGQILS